MNTEKELEDYGKDYDDRGSDYWDDIWNCTFCGKHRNEVRKLINGPNAAICDECVELCVDILRVE